MTPPEKSKNKGRPYPLRRVLLVMVMGVAFMFWMPFVIVTGRAFGVHLHWLNYLIYWGAAVVWLLPLVRWLKQHTFLPRVQRLRTILLLVVLWLFLMGGGWFVTKRGLVPPVRNNDLRCGIYFPYYPSDHTGYECHIPQSRFRGEEGGYKLICTSAPHGYTDCFYISSRVDAEGPEDFPIARTTSIYTNIHVDSYRDEVGGDG